MRARAGLVLIVALAAVVTYLPSLRNGFLWDDGRFITNNAYIKSLRHFPSYFASVRPGGPEVPQIPIYRPLLIASFAIDHAGALRHAMAALELDPERPGHYVLLARAQEASGSDGKALRTLEAGASRCPDSASVMLALGEARRDSGDLAGAEKAWLSAAHLDPDAAAPRVDLGTLAHLEGRLDEAIGLWREALEADPDSLDAMFNLAVFGAGRVPDPERRELARRFLARADLREMEASIARSVLEGTR